MNALRGQFAITGTGEVPSGRFPDRTALQAALSVSVDAIRDSGLDASEIDVILPTGAFFSRQFNTDLVFSRLAEDLGLNRKAKANIQVMAGGASSAALLTVAGALVTSGAARAVLCVHSDKIASLPKQEVFDLFATLGISEEWETPFGHSMNAVGALITERYMHETGATPAQMASVCVSMRRWAQLNPNARFRKPLTVEDVLASRVISTPLHALECNVLVDGAAAFVVTTAERAASLDGTAAYFLGHGSRVTHYSISQETDLSQLGFRDAADQAFEAAGVGPEDVGLAAFYDAYPVFPLITLEGVGLCKPGEAARFVAAGHTMPGGRMPMTTNGGMLSQGHSGAGGGIAVLVEAARQLMGKAGARQVPNLRCAVESASGGTYMDSHITVLASEVPA